ncbi:MAG: recombinase RecT [Pusillimonas sp.]
MDKELQTTKAKQSLSPINSIRTLLERSKTQIAMALPKHLNADRIIRVAMTSIQRTPQLLECDPITLVGAVIQSSQLGLEPDGILGHAYLVPFRNTKKNRMEVQFIPGYKGLIDLARRSGQVNRISAHVVYENETFTMEYGTKEILEHKPLPPSTRGDRKGVYAVAVLNDGSPHFEWLWNEEIEAIKRQSKAVNFGPWKTHEDEMIRKTAIRRLVKYLPLSVELAKAAAVDELVDAGISTQELFELDEVLPVIEAKPTTIDDALNQIAEQAEQTETAESDSNNVNTLESVIAEIESYNIPSGPMTAYAIRALGENKKMSEWTLVDAQKVLEAIRKMKGIRK